MSSGVSLSSSVVIAASRSLRVALLYRSMHRLLLPHLNSPSLVLPSPPRHESVSTPPLLAFRSHWLPTRILAHHPPPPRHPHMHHGCLSFSFFFCAERSALLILFICWRPSAFLLPPSPFMPFSPLRLPVEGEGGVDSAPPLVHSFLLFPTCLCVLFTAALYRAVPLSKICTAPPLPSEPCFFYYYSCRLVSSPVCLCGCA